jgi:hypothetical protein
MAEIAIRRPILFCLILVTSQETGVVLEAQACGHGYLGVVIKSRIAVA